MSEQTYIGDGVYASFDCGQIKLSTDRDRAQADVIYLEPETYAALVKFAHACWAPFPQEVPDRQPF